ncbi:MAG: phosphoribosylanthranilate isomerase [Lachnospiraceae bacterium]|nr:phosphoribosylanthranilate isomerase [Lachnospiraceae bacterium]
MTKIKLCGLRFDEDIECVNELLPEYIGFVFWSKSKRYITPEEAKCLKDKLNPKIKAVGVFVDEDIKSVESLVKDGIIDIVQLHGNEDEAYIKTLKQDAGCEVIKAFKLKADDENIDLIIRKINNSSADFVLLDSGMGTGKVFDWSLIKSVKRPYFLAGGLTYENVGTAVKELKPYAVDASSSLETDGRKDRLKMQTFVSEVRKVSG